MHVYGGSFDSARGLLYVGIENNAGSSSTGTLDVVGGTVNAGAELHIGAAIAAGARANGTFTLSGGTVTTDGQQDKNTGVRIGFASGGGQGRGTFTMTNGVLTVWTNGLAGQAPLAYPYREPISGFTIGEVRRDDTSSTNIAWGSATISGGTITNSGTFAIGVNGGGTGTLVQTGGTIVHAPESVNFAQWITVIGYGCGTNTYSGAGNGTYEMYGGSYVTPNQVFVGGVPTNIQPFARGGTVGLLKIVGGNLRCSNTVYVGANGSGSLLIGSNGVLTCGNMVLSNNTASKLRFEVAPDGTVGQLVVTNKLTIASGAKLEVYVPRSYCPDVALKVLILATCATRDGAFANPPDVTVSNYPGATVVQTTTNIQVLIPSRRGTIMIIR